jgi:uncharacterized protein
MIQLNGLATELFDEIKKIPVVDCHEHLPTEAERTAQTVDVTTLFSHYCKGDLEAAGLPQGPAQDDLLDTQKPLGPRWEKLKPYIEAIRFGSYAYPAFVYVRDVLGFDDINDDTVEAISEKLNADNQAGIYQRVLGDLCGIERSIQCVGSVVPDDQPFFSYLAMDRVHGLSSAAQLDGFQAEMEMAIHTLDDFVEALGAFVSREKEAGAVGLKSAAAYMRTIDYPDVPRAEADALFARLRSNVRANLSDAETTVLENYLFRREIEACIEVGMPVVIHTGYQAGNQNDIRTARATHLWSLLKAYPQARFDLFHGSFPYVSDMTVLGKYFGNVTLNMCWMHIMGPEVSRRALREWLDAVPVTKIFAFGGDYSVVEKVYGHLELARSDVAVVLAERIEAGRMTQDEALRVARLLFNENPKRWYGI